LQLFAKFCIINYKDPSGTIRKKSTGYAHTAHPFEISGIIGNVPS